MLCNNRYELYHHGILGQKWGVRRYQNADGTLTAAGKARQEKKDSKWAQKNYDKIYNKSYKKSSKELNRYVSKELNTKYSEQVKSGKLSKSYINEYNRKLAELMNKSTKDITAPSGKVVQFVAKRGEVGVHMALADRGYDMSQLKNGVWASGKVAYKNKSVNMSHSDCNYSTELYHYGVKGMKWGVRRTKDQLQYDSGSIKTVLNRSLREVKTPNNVPVQRVTKHALDRIENNSDRKVTSHEIIDALKNPIHIDDERVDEDGNPSIRYIGNKATANVNPQNGNITTVWKTGERVRKKYLQKG